jgi:glycosyltransferase involved in cell wall biosynthesis
MTTTPRVLLLDSALHFGGAENVIAELCRGLDRDRFEVHVGYTRTRGRLGQVLADEGFSVVDLAAKGRPGRDYGGPWRLRRFIKSQGIRLVHSHDLASMVDSALCRLSLPRVQHVNTFHYGNYPHASRRHHLLEKFLSRAATGLVAVGQVQKAQLAGCYGLRENRLHVIRNGVSDVRAGALRHLEAKLRGSGRVVIGTIGALIEQKGMFDLLEVAARLKAEALDFRWVVAGSGALRATLESKAREMGLAGHVEFLGWVDHAPVSVLPWIDVFVQTSRWEAMSMVVLEAMSCGLPIVATTVGENPLVIEDTINGYLVPTRGIAEMVDRLRVLVASDSLRSQLGHRARQDWEQRYTSALMCRQYENLYAELLGCAAPAPSASGVGQR